jgi:hypothetical protein
MPANSAVRGHDFPLGGLETAVLDRRSELPISLTEPAARLCDARDPDGDAHPPRMLTRIMATMNAQLRFIDLFRSEFQSSILFVVHQR